ncbi:MAG: radical SAM protein [Nitrospinae bacterium]|nr:radical SAM protein [Nitrospinota bacterium]
MTASYLNLSLEKLQQRADDAYEIYRSCHVCPHACEVNRTEGETGFCGQVDTLHISSSVQHFGEEPPLVGVNGVGNLFVTACNMRCDYCQNFQISQEWKQGGAMIGSKESYHQVADAMLRLQEQGVHFIGWVSPSHVVPGLLKSLVLAREKGLRLPIIYNSNSYDALETLKLLDGVVDIYLPDLKYSDPDKGRKISHIKSYPEYSRQAVLEMFRQVGPLSINDQGLAEKGVLVRHLILPDQLTSTWETLCFVALELSTSVPLSLMSQYRPVHKAKPGLDRTINSEEYEQAITWAKELGFESLFLQSLESQVHNLPDFSSPDNPFPLDRARNTINV